MVHYLENDEVVALQNAMERTRQRLHDEVGKAAETARTLTDWKYHARKHPLGLLTLAVAAGYILVPRRPQPAEHASISQSRSQTSTKIASAVTGAIGNVLLRTAIDVLSREIDKRLTGKTEQPSVSQEECYDRV
jgi:hypothetical protein